MFVSQGGQAEGDPGRAGGEAGGDRGKPHCSSRQEQCEYFTISTKNVRNLKKLTEHGCGQRERGKSDQKKHLSTVVWFPKRYPHSSKAGSKKVHFHTKLFAVWPKLNLSLFQDLRSKNRKAMEALNEMEQKYVKLLKTQQAA